MKARNVKRTAVAVVVGSLLGSGGCIPDNFWANVWSGALYTAVDTVVGYYVLIPFTEAVTEEDED